MNGSKPTIQIKSGTLQVFPRLHLTLISMGRKGYRKNGGIGLALSKPSLSISFEASPTIGFHDSRQHSFDLEQKRRLQNVLEILRGQRGFNSGIDIFVSGDLPTNYGFGSGTAIRLGCVESLYLVNGVPYESIDIIRASRRAGTSGIGIHTYFGGGMVFDLGHKHLDIDFAPSSHREGLSELPLLATQCALPNWQVGLCLPSTLRTVSGRQEEDFFRATCPLNEEEVCAIVYHSVFGVMGAVLDQNYDTFAKAVKNLQKTSWKHAERALHEPKLSQIEDQLYDSGALAVGMSSLGPSLFFLAHDVEEVCTRFRKGCTKHLLMVSNTSNCGRKFLHA